MKRFGDILRILSSVLVGSVIKDFDALRDKLFLWFGDWWVAELTAVMLVALFVRNIHGSAQFDEWVENHEFTPTFEKTLAGRYSAFAFAILALFLGPFLASHMFVNHPPALWLGIVVLFLSPGVYFCWDFLLWKFEKDPDDPKLIMKDVSLRWMQINVAALVLSFGVLLFYWAGHSFNLPNIVVGRDFVAVAAFIIVVDYFSNHSFYFAERPTQPSPPATTVPA